MNNDIINRKNILKKQVILVSQNFKLVYKVKEAILDVFDFIHLTIDDTKIQTSQFIFTSIEEKKKFAHSNFIGLSPNWSNITILSSIILTFDSRQQSKCIIGIDPGLSTGTSVLLNGNLLDTCVFYSVINVLRWIKNKFKLVVADEHIIKIGNGGGRYQSNILKYLDQNLPKGIHIEIIDEKKTSIKENAEMTIHEQAAIKIAKRNGIKINRS